MAAPEVTSFTDAALEWQGEPGTAGNAGTWSVNEKVSYSHGARPVHPIITFVRQKGTERSLWGVGAEAALVD